MGIWLNLRVRFRKTDHLCFVKNGWGLPYRYYTRKIAQAFLLFDRDFISASLPAGRFSAGRQHNLLRSWHWISRHKKCCTAVESDGSRCRNFHTKTIEFPTEGSHRSRFLLSAEE